MQKLKAMNINDSIELIKYFGRAMRDFDLFSFPYTEANPEIVTVNKRISFPMTPKQAEKAVAKFPEPLEELKTLFTYAPESITLEWNLKDFVGKFSPIARIEIWEPKSMAKNINPDMNMYWTLDLETGKGKTGYIDELNLKGKALKEFKESLPKLYYFDYYAEADEYTVLWFYQGKHGLALVTSQGEDIEILPWTIGEYLKYAALTLGLVDWQKSILNKCKDANIKCIIEETLKVFEDKPEHRKALEKFFEEYHKIVGDIPSVLLKAYINVFGKTPEENLEKIKHLLQNENANPNIVFGDYETPLMKAARTKDVKLAEILLEHGADVNIKDKLGRTALHFVLDKSKVEMPLAIAILKQNVEFDDNLIEMIIDKKVLTKKRYTDNPELKNKKKKMIETSSEELLKEKLLPAIKKLKDKELLEKAENRIG